MTHASVITHDKYAWMTSLRGIGCATYDAKSAMTRIFGFWKTLFHRCSYASLVRSCASVANSSMLRG